MQNLESSIVVKDSAIHGKGIFASKNISAGQLIMFIEGEVISGEECERREEEENNVYIFWNGNNYIDTAGTDKIKFINHHCDPNCEVTDGDTNTLQLIAKRKIYSGEEILMDYGYDEIYEQCTCSKCQKSSTN
ncbi:MAG: SET domain-containing protein [Melioribacteraceae bacterium]|nr:SET domain-containing protein [Melioribacteraceae bacterium]MCF8412934.1 SET domain-containing protein [Melioribacteraceae bacterium]